MPFDTHELTCLQRGLEHFRTGDYFAAHDDWEEVWQGLNGRPRLFWQAMIQLVVGAYHYTNGNMRGCRNVWHKALARCDTLVATADAPLPEPVNLLDDLLRTVLAAVEDEHDPLPALTTFATTMMSAAWFEAL